MIEVRRSEKNDASCSACDPDKEGIGAPSLLAVSVGGNSSSATTRLCESCARKLLNALAFMYASATDQSIPKALGFAKRGAR